MKSVFILAGATLAAAQYFPGEPACATACLSAAIVQVGCDLNDVSCQCGPTKSAIGTAALSCLLGSCNVNELVQAQSAGNAVCSSLSAGELTISSTASGSVSTTSSMSITSAASTSTTEAASTGQTSSGSDSSSDSLSNSLTRSGNTIVSGTTSASETKTLVGTVNTPTASSGASISASTTGNAAPTAGVAKVAILAGALGVVAVL